MKNILLVEDDTEIVNLLRLHLNEPIYFLTACSSGKDAIHKALFEDYHLIILDIMLPDTDGLEVCKTLREKHINSPIMMLTARSEEIDKVLALEIGADDYLTKPFGIRELLARTKALLRRAEQSQTVSPETKREIKYKDLLIDKHNRKASVRGERMELTPKEFDLLVLLASNPGKTFSRPELLKQVWEYAFSGYEHTITSHINRLRIKLESDVSNPEYILTSWGIGYRFSE